MLTDRGNSPHRLHVKPSHSKYHYYCTPLTPPSMRSIDLSEPESTINIESLVSRQQCSQRTIVYHHELALLVCCPHVGHRYTRDTEVNN
jgi:hypothetical protein